MASGEGLKVYLDGVLKNTDSTRGGDAFNPTTDLFLGARSTTQTDRWYGGSLDSVQLFNRALSAEEVNDTHTGGSSLATVNVLVNDPPVNNVPDGQMVNEDTTLVFNTANSNLISISDGDAGSNPLRVTLTATNGTMTLSQTTGLTFSTGDGTSDTTMVFEGTLTNINAALDGLQFLGDSDFNGAANIQITTDDLTLTSLNEDTSQEGYYTFDDTGNLGNDSSQGANHGTVNGAVTNSDATRGNVLEFDGFNDNVEITGLMGSPANVTLAAWVNLDAGTSDGEIISIGDYVAIRADESGGEGVQAFFYDGSSWHNLDSATYIAGTGWHHVAYVFDDTSNTQTLYIDGIAVASGTRTESITYSGQGSNTFIGQHGNATTNNFDGKIDDARIYDRALTLAEIQNLAFEPTSTDTDNIAITVNAQNDTASVTNLSGDTLNYTEGDGAVVIEQGDDVVVSDVDSTDFDTGSLTVAFTAGSDSAEDVLAIRNQGTGVGQIGVSGSNVTYAGTTIGTFTGGTSGANLVITLNSNADPTATTALIKNITYENTDTDDPTTGSRSVRFTLNDGDGGATIRTTTVNVSAVNDEPTFTATGSDPTYTEGGSAVGLFTGTAISTVETGQTISGLTFTVTNVTETGQEQTTIDGTTITLDNGESGSTTDFTYSVSVSGTTATVTLSGGTASVANVVNDIDAMTYINNSQDPTDANRVVTFTQIVDSGGTANGGDDTGTPMATSTVNVDPVNDPATVGTNTGLTVTEGGSVVITNAMLNEGDPDDSGTGITYRVAGDITDGSLLG